MNKGSSLRQRGQFIRAASKGEIDSSPSQARHLKCMLAFTKVLLVVLLTAVSVQAQSVAEAARKERERQANAHSTHVITSTKATPVEESKKTPVAAEPSAPAETKNVSADASRQSAKPQPPSSADPVQAWNNRLAELRAKVQDLQDHEIALELQENQAINQVYAPVTDPATQERALAHVAEIRQQRASTRKNLDDARRALQTMQLEGPPKK
jgi:DNA polymerase III gamma/tau subunit